MSDLFKRLRVFLGLRKSMVGLLSMVVLIGLGERMAERFLPIYIMALGGSVIAIGMFSAMNNLLGALYSFPGGYIANRIGSKKALLIFNGMALLGYAVVILVPTWEAVIVGSIFFLSWTAISLPASMSLVSKILPKNKRTMGVTLHSLVRRFPMALGPVIGGLFIGAWGEQMGVRYAFICAFVLAVLSAIMQQILMDDPVKEAKTELHSLSPFTVMKYMNPALRNLLVADILIRFCEQIPSAFIVIWCMKIIVQPISAVQFGWLTSVEMATAVLIYIPVAYLADKGTKKPFIVMTFVFFSLFPLALLFSTSITPLIVAFAVRGLKEFGEPTRKALIMDLAPENLEDAMFGLYYLLRDIIVAFAAFGGALLWKISPAINFITAFSFGAVGTIWFIVFGRNAKTESMSDTGRA